MIKKEIFTKVSDLSSRIKNFWALWFNKEDHLRIKMLHLKKLGNSAYAEIS